MQDLDTYLDHALSRPWAWGGMDCCFFAGDWIADRTGLDPLAPYRGIYGTEFAARRLIVARGGLNAMVALEMERCGFRTAIEPEHGDIAVMNIPGDRTGSAVAGAAVVIRCATWWLGRTQTGVAGFHGVPATAWRVA